MFISEVKIKRIFVLLIFLILLVNKTFSQCCSAGSPVGASTYVGILNKNTLRTIASYRYSFLNEFYRGNEFDKTINHAPLKNTFYNYTNLSIGYGLFKKLTTEAEIGYYINKTQTYEMVNKPIFTKRGFGLSATTISLKYSILKIDSSMFELTFASGVKIPFSSKPQYDENNLQLPHEIQPSTGAYGAVEQLFISKGVSPKLKLFSYNRFEWNSENPYNYKYGYFLLNSVFISRKFNNFISGIFEIRNEKKSKDFNFISNSEQVNTGSHVIMISPKVSFVIAKKWYLACLLDIPVYKNYVGSQISSKYSFAASLTRDFNLTNKNKCK